MSDVQSPAIEAVEKARIEIVEAAKLMQPGRAQVGPTLARLANAVQALADGIEALAKGSPDA